MILSHKSALDQFTAQGESCGEYPKQEAPAGTVRIVTNGTIRDIPANEPVFLIRGQDSVGAAAVRFWANLAENAGADNGIVAGARAHACKMDAWPKKKVPDAKPKQEAPAADEAAYILAGILSTYGVNTSAPPDFCLEPARAILAAIRANPEKFVPLNIRYSDTEQQLRAEVERLKAESSMRLKGYNELEAKLAEAEKLVQDQDAQTKRVMNQRDAAIRERDAAHARESQNAKDVAETIRTMGSYYVQSVGIIGTISLMRSELDMRQHRIDERKDALARAEKAEKEKEEIRQRYQDVSRLGEVEAQRDRLAGLLREARREILCHYKYLSKYLQPIAPDSYIGAMLSRIGTALGEIVDGKENK